MSERRFKENEIPAVGMYKSYGTYYGGPHFDAAKYNTPVSARENFRLFLEHKPFYWVMDSIRDTNCIYPEIIPDCVACGYEGGIDSFGVEWIPVENNPELPAFVKPGKPMLEDVCEWRTLKFPDVDSWDWEASGRAYGENVDPDRPNVGILLSGFFERLISLMTFEGAAMALIEEPEETASFMEALCDYNISVIEHYKKYHHVDAVLVHDDWGSQRAPFFSRKTLQEIILPAYTRMVTRAHELGVFVISHSCGNCTPLVEDMISTGTDVWQAQPSANPDLPEAIKACEGRLCFDFGMELVIEGEETPESYEAACAECFKKLASGGNVMLSTFTYGIGITPEGDAINYKIARMTASGEL